MIKKLVRNLTTQKDAQRKAELYRKLIHREAQIGGQIFGPVAQGGRREFFCMDPYTWVWHEEWIDANGQHQYATTRYDIRPNGVVKSQNGQYKNITRPEARNLLRAVYLYQNRVERELYSFVV